MASVAMPFAGDGTAVARAESVPTSRFVPTTPCRRADSRTGADAAPAGEHRWRVDVRGRCGVPEGASAIAVSIVAISRDEPGWMTAHAARSPQPSVSIVNYGPGEVRSNGAVVQVDHDGLIVAASGPADFALDVTGYFAAAVTSAQGRYQPLEPARLADTRPAAPVTSSLTVPLPP